MEAKFKIGRLSPGCALLLALVAGSAFAQVSMPNSGSLMNTPMTPPLAQPKFPSFEVQKEPPPALVLPSDVKVKVARFRFSGNTVVSETVLQELLKEQTGRELDLVDLDRAASIVSRYYRSNGYLVARAYLPAQEISSGNLEIAIIEGRLGAVKFSRNGATRLSEQRAQSLVQNAMPVGSPVNEQRMERGLMLLNDLPGVDVKSTLLPGATPGTTDLVIETSEGALTSASIDGDNYGNQFTGSTRVGGTVNLNDITGIGDQIVMRGMTSGAGMSYGRLSYSAPVGVAGTKVGLAYSDMQYKLGSDFAALNATGESSVTTLFAVHPLLRSRNTNAYVTGSYDTKSLNDSQNGTVVADKRISVFSLGPAADARDPYGGGGMNSASLSLTGGQLNLDGNAAYAANDAATANTSGNFTKLGYNLSRLQRFSESLSGYVGLSGQFGGKNLDSSEKFSLGGSGVRAYPQGEASGDTGILLNLEARYNLSGIEFGTVQVVGFMDVGSITQHQSVWNGWQPTGRPDFPNTYSLSGAGLGLNLYRGEGFSLRTAVAWKLGSNPGADIQGRDSDGSDRSPRFWLQASMQF